MKASVRLGLYGLILVAVFGVAAVAANAIVPEQTVRNWMQETHGAGHRPEGQANAGEHGPGAASLGLSLEQNGYRLASVAAPEGVGAEGQLSLVITGPDGNPVTDFEPKHEKELHLIVVRADGQHFRHVHPELAADGTWSIPWQWDAGGTYRVFADFVPTQTGDDLTVSTSVQVAGDYAPVPTQQVTTVSVDGYDVSVEGSLVAGETSQLTMSITQDGDAVTALEPYLGAFGHLVALRDGDLAYLHVHPLGAEPEPGQSSGPEIIFEVTAPTPGRYLLYLDFQIGGEVHTAPLVIDTSAQTDSGSKEGDGSGATHGPGHEEGAGHGHGN